MATTEGYAEEKNTRRVALQTQVNSILDSLAQRVQALEIERQATDLRGFDVDRLVKMIERINALAKDSQGSAIPSAPPASIAQLKHTLHRVLNSVGSLEADRYEPFPLPEEVRDFRIVELGERD